MDEFLSSLLTCLGHINPIYAAVALGLWILFGDKIKDLLANIKLPKFPSPGPKPEPLPAPTPDTDLDAWLEQHPLLDILWRRLKDNFAHQVVNGEADEEDTFIALSQAVKGAVPKPRE